MKDGLELGKKLKQRNPKSVQRIKRKCPFYPLALDKAVSGWLGLGVGWCVKRRLASPRFFLLLRWLLCEKGEGLEMAQMFSTQGWAHRSVKSHLSTRI